MMTTDDKALLDKAYEMAFPLMEETSLFVQILRQSDELKFSQAEVAGFRHIVERWHLCALDLIETLGNIRPTDTGEVKDAS